MNRINIIGNSLSALVAALTLSEETDSRITLYSDGRPLGGHFLGPTLEQTSFDNGMIYVEKGTDSAIESNNKSPYNPLVRYDWTRFGGELNKFLSKYLALNKVSTPICYLNSRYYPDPLIANRLDMMKDFTGTLPSLELKGSIHPKFKNKESHFDYWENITYIDAVKYLHGSDFHNLVVAPFFNKLCPPESRDEILAKYHRMLWLPLYYPETINESFISPNELPLTEYDFFRPATNYVGELIIRLMENLKSSSNVEIINEPIKKISTLTEGMIISFESTDRLLEFDQTFYSGLAMDRFLNLTGQTILPRENLKYTGLKICYLLVKTSSIQRTFSTLNLLDMSSAPLRISNADRPNQDLDGYSRITIEYPLDFHLPGGGEAPSDTQIRADLGKYLGIVNTALDIKILKKIVLEKALVLPIRSNINIYEKMRRSIADDFPWINFFESSSYYGSASMNDQIIQGISLSKGFYE